MKLQVTLDILDLGEALEYLKLIRPYADIVEVGTPLSLMEGIRAVREIKARYPDLMVLDDIKLCDGGGRSSHACLSRGADIITILGVSDDKTILAGMNEAHKLGKQIMVDMIHVRNLEERLKQVDELGVDIIGIHAGVDQQSRGKNPLDDLKIAKKCVNRAAISVAGGLKDDEFLDSILGFKPDILVVGNGIYKAANPAFTARRIKERIDKAEKRI